VIEVDDVCRTVSLVLGSRVVNADDRLIEDLGAESMDILGVIATIEEKYGVTIDETAIASISTVRDVYDVVSKSPHAPLPAADPGRTA
jgi:acyl carrier protein